MAKRLLFCVKCQRYTMKQVCSCGEKTAEKKPAKFSPEDKYAHYRRAAKEERRKKEGLV
ncbi:MAG: nucleolar RNA-binding Nop10p family protein [Nanoarchaeota archaeon]